MTTLLSVYACTKGAPVLLEKMELLDCSTGESQSPERPDCTFHAAVLTPLSFPATALFEPLKSNQLGRTFEISWDRLNLREQKTFIKSYTVYYTNSQKQLNQSECKWVFFFHSKFHREKKAADAPTFRNIHFPLRCLKYQTSDFYNFSSFERRTKTLDGK